jgi:hypothetical protein
MSDQNQAPATPAAILDAQTAQATLNLATPETAALTTIAERYLEAAAALGDADAKHDAMRVYSGLLLLDITKQHLQLVLATVSGTLVDCMAAVPDGPLRDRLGSQITYLGQLPMMELRAVLHELARVQAAEHTAAVEAKFGIGTTH